MITLGFADWTPSIAARTAAILSFAVSALPLTSNWTSAEWRSRETRPAFGCSIGETMFMTFACCESVRTTPATADANAGSPTATVLDWTSTLSRAGRLKPARSRIRSACRDSPFVYAHGFSCLAPTAPPTTIARTAIASQPKAAVFQCPELQRPARPARLTLTGAPSLAAPPRSSAPAPTARHGELRDQASSRLVHQVPARSATATHITRTTTAVPADIGTASLYSSGAK